MWLFLHQTMKEPQKGSEGTEKPCLATGETRQGFSTLSVTHFGQEMVKALPGSPPGRAFLCGALNNTHTIAHSVSQSAIQQHCDYFTCGMSAQLHTTLTST